MKGNTIIEFLLELIAIVLTILFFAVCRDWGSTYESQILLMLILIFFKMRGRN